MKIVIIGASGAIGSAVARELAPQHEIIEVGSRSGAYQLDMADMAQVRSLFERLGKVDAVVVTAGKLHFAPLAELTPEQFQVGLASKLMGQVNVALVAQHYLNDGGSITLTSGIIAEQPIRLGAAASTTNAAVEGFVRGAAVELGRGLRINVVSPTVLQESMDKYAAFFPGFEPAAASRVALAYRRSVEGVQTGQVFRVW